MLLTVVVAPQQESASKSVRQSVRQTLGVAGVRHHPRGRADDRPARVVDVLPDLDAADADVRNAPGTDQGVDDRYAGANARVREVDQRQTEHRRERESHSPVPEDVIGRGCQHPHGQYEPKRYAVGYPRQVRVQVGQGRRREDGAAARRRGGGGQDPRAEREGGDRHRDQGQERAIEYAQQRREVGYDHETVLPGSSRFLLHRRRRRRHRRRRRSGGVSRSRKTSPRRQWW